jgi:hypothetical protein
MRLCVDCKHFQPGDSNYCYAPKVISMVDGSPGDPQMQRYEIATEGDDFCGREGKFWSPIKAAKRKKKKGSAAKRSPRKQLAKP